MSLTCDRRGREARSSQLQVDHSLGVFCPQAVGPAPRPRAGQLQARGYNHPTAPTDRQDKKKTCKTDRNAKCGFAPLPYL